MADSKLAQDQALMIAAMAYRVKYRVMEKAENSNTLPKMQVRIENLGVHKMNRGGVYPSGLRCKSLCTDVVTVGFLEEDATHA